MNPYRVGPPPKWWGPKLSPWFFWLSSPIRRRMRLRKQRLVSVDVQGLEHLRKARDDGCGILITPNHAAHADPFAIYEVADQVPCPFYFMATWHVFVSQGMMGQWALQRAGIFSVDRDGADIQAFKAAVKILHDRRFPLVIFPEGEIYHCNDRVTPFREGPATIALSAARRAEGPIVCLPCAVKYEYQDDPTPELERTMDELELQIHWRPKQDTPLHERIYAFAQAMLALKELEYLGAVSAGDLPARVSAMTEAILARLEKCHECERDGATIPERIKEVRRRVISELESPDATDEARSQLVTELEDIFFVSQLFSYPGDYVAQRPTIERLAETFDKFEEDVLHRSKATIRGTRKATVYLDEPIRIEGKKRSKAEVAALTDQIESCVQRMLDQHAAKTIGA